MFKEVTHSLRSRIAPSKDHLSALRGDVQSRLRGFGSGRETARQEMLENDFALVLEAWGIEEKSDIPDILRDLRLRCLILLAPVSAASLAAVFSRSPLSLLTLALIAPPCLFGVVATRWRMSVLKKRAFVPLLRWLRKSAWKRP
jgi:hypothetical protein